MKKVAVILGTRPEVIKLYPVIKKLGDRACVVFTGQHVDMGNQMLEEFDIEPKYSLGAMFDNKNLNSLSASILESVDKALNVENPDVVLVQGDTASALMGALAAFNLGIPVGHVEAGLRTYDLKNPFPEEGNRRMISQIATYHFVPTVQAKLNLEMEWFDGEIIESGNTGIDTLLHFAEQIEAEEKNQVLVTLHRRENQGVPMKEILKGISMFLEDNPTWRVVIPVHPNPLVGSIIVGELRGNDQVDLVSPLGYLDMIRVMKESKFIITDSGGIQEEAPSLYKPVLVTRIGTERPEGIQAGLAELVGTDKNLIAERATKLAQDESFYNSMITDENPYGDGHAAERIVGFLDGIGKN